jgi:hypothetical protein
LQVLAPPPLLLPVQQRPMQQRPMQQRITAPWRGYFLASQTGWPVLRE